MAGWGAIRYNTVSALREHSERMALLQEQASSGMRVIRASDEPADAFRILNLRAEVRNYETYSENLRMVDFNMSQISEVLQSIVTNLTRVRELTTQATSGTYNQENRALAGLEIDAILESAVSMINSESMGRQLFGGSRLDGEPYTVSRDAEGQISAVHYQGTQVKLKAALSPGIEYPATVVGDEVFRSYQPGSAEIIMRNSGTGLGNGTSSARGDIWLTLSHDVTTITDTIGSGVGVGSGSAAGDTIFGDHTLTIANVAGKDVVRLDGGDEIPFTNQTNLKVVNEDGDVAYVDMSGWTGVYGAITLRSSALASIDGGQTTVPVDPAKSNQAVANADGKVLYCDFTTTDRIASDPIRMTGSYDLFGTLTHVRDTLLNKPDLDSQEQSDVLNHALESLKDLMAGLTQHLTSVGARLQAIDGLENSISDMSFNSESEANKIQDADVVEVATELANTQTFYEMILASSSKLLRMTLLDYL